MQRTLIHGLVTFILCSSLTVADTFALPYFQDSGDSGLVVIEAENYDRHVPQGDHQWEAVSIQGASGAAMQALPNSGANLNSDYLSTSPRLDFDIEFVKTGTHYVWVRGFAASKLDDSLHVGLDGEAVDSSDRITRFTTSTWTWTARTMDGPVARIEVATTGLHTLNVWMREDGFILDKIVVTTSSIDAFSGSGPDESPRESADTDGDGWMDAGDNCALIPNPDQEDIDGDGFGDICDICPNDIENDADGDGFCADIDGCPYDANKALPGVCGCDVPETDIDGDGWLDCQDNCLNIANPEQEDTDNDGLGDVCEGMPYFQDSGDSGLVVIEAENYDRHVPQGDHQWEAVSIQGASGAAMQALPNSGANLNSDYLSTSPRLDFDIEFVKTGTHYVWVRGFAASKLDDSLHVGLDGEAVDSSDRITRFTTSTWTWTARTMDGPVARIEVATTGLHTLNVWMREDGFILDKIVVTTSSIDAFSGSGPDESPRESADTDGDGWMDAGDNCALIPNPDQEDIDGDGFGDICDICPNDIENDADGDGFCADIDGCPYDANKALPGVCGCDVPETDIDGDGWLDCQDNCLNIANPEQEDTDNDGLGDVCEGMPYFQDSGDSGLVVIEAENYDRHVPQGDHQWEAVSIQGASGAAMQALPNSGANLNSDYLSTSPRLDFDIEFVKTGTHYVWVRGFAASKLDDSLHVGLDGEAVDSSDRITRFTTSTWTWTARTMDGPVARIEVATTGLHTLNVWMREDGFILDKIVVTTSSIDAFSGSGPDESPRESAPPFENPVLNIQSVKPFDNGGDDDSEIEVELQVMNTAVGWKIQCVLDENTSNQKITTNTVTDPDQTNYHILFTAVRTWHRHNVECRLLDSSDNAIQDPFTSDGIIDIITGNYIIAAGDSNTSSGHDTVTEDNASLDGRDTSGGFPPILNDLMTSDNGYAHTVKNEGRSGDTSADGLQRMTNPDPGQNIFTLHPFAHIILIAYGTNDAFAPPTPSGLDEKPPTPGTLKANLYGMIEAAQARGTSPYIAKIPKAYDTFHVLNKQIELFNLVIDQVINEVNGLEPISENPDVYDTDPDNDILVEPPDFYELADSNPFDPINGDNDVWDDGLHWDGFGLKCVADYWRDAMNFQAQGCDPVP
jgi:lysophospholipase L1-like esterase